MRDSRTRRESEDDDAFETDMVRHYKALFFQRNQEASTDSDMQINGSRESKMDGFTESSNYHRVQDFRSPRYENYAGLNADISNRESFYGAESSGYNWIDKYKANIVPPHMKRTHRPTNRSNNSPFVGGSEVVGAGISNTNPARTVLNSNPMSTFSPQEIPPYFSPPVLLRKEGKRPSATEEESESMDFQRPQIETETEAGNEDEGENENDKLKKLAAELGETNEHKVGEEATSETRGERSRAGSEGPGKGSGKGKGKGKGVAVATEKRGSESEMELRELQLRLKAAEAKLIEHDAASSARIEELEEALRELSDMKLEDKGRTVNLQRQLTNLTAERQEKLLALRRLEDEKASLKEELERKAELIEMLKMKDKLLSDKLRTSEQKRIELQSEIEAERTTMANTDTSKRLKDALYRISELEAINHALRESIKQKQ